MFDLKITVERAPFIEGTFIRNEKKYAFTAWMTENKKPRISIYEGFYREGKKISEFNFADIRKHIRTEVLGLKE